MLSVSSKQRTPITRHWQRLRTAGSSGTSSLRQQQRARLTTAAAASTGKQQQPLVISRRAWLKFKESHGITKKRPDASKRPKSDDEKPWPRNVQIAGYVAGAVAVPYIILWTITSNPTLREWFGPYIPLDKLRTHYGKLEWDAQSYSEEMEDAENNEKNGNDESKVPIGYYQFPEEAPFKERQQQEIVEAMSQSDINVTLSLSSSSSSPSPSAEYVTKKISAKTVANENDLLKYLPSALVSTDKNTSIAIDFLDRNDEDNAGEKIDATSNTDLLSNDSPSRSQQLTKDSQTTSKWAYVPQSAEGGSKKTANNTSSVSQVTETDIEMGRLQYEISELEKNLRDPMCTRSIDDMTTELRQAKRELSRLTWKKRFGFSR